MFMLNVMFDDFCLYPHVSYIPASSQGGLSLHASLCATKSYTLNFRTAVLHA